MDRESELLGLAAVRIQRALAAESLSEAQKGVTFAAYLKLLMPVIIACYRDCRLKRPDESVSTMMRLPAGIAGLVFAALIAAIIASTASRSIPSRRSSIDIYNKIGEPKARRAW